MPCDCDCGNCTGTAGCPCGCDCASHKKAQTGNTPEADESERR